MEIDCGESIEWAYWWHQEINKTTNSSCISYRGYSCPTFGHVKASSKLLTRATVVAFDEGDEVLQVVRNASLLIKNDHLAAITSGELYEHVDATG